MAVLGVREHRFLGLPDGGLAQIDPEAGIGMIADLIDEVRPDTILTFGPDGMTFHDDHMTISRCTTEAWVRRGRPGRLLHAALTVEHVEQFAELYEERAST